MLREDIRITMPPYPYLFEGRENIRAGWRRRSGWRRWATGASSPRPPTACPPPAATSGSGRTPEFRAFKLDVIRMVDGQVAEVTTFGAALFPAFRPPADPGRPARPGHRLTRDQSLCIVIRIEVPSGLVHASQEPPPAPTLAVRCQTRP